jgi:excisionase family DNA binding protein
MNDKSATMTLDTILDALAVKLAARLHPGSLGVGEPKIQPRLLTVEQAAAYIGRSKEAVQHMTAARKIPVVRDGRRVFLDVKVLDRWIDQNTEPAED